MYVDLLACWEQLLAWSENAAAARGYQEDMSILKRALTRLGNNATEILVANESALQYAIEGLNQEKVQLQNYRTKMLHLNASVHSWLTRQERHMASDHAHDNESGMATKLRQNEVEFHQQLKDDVSDMYVSWDNADARVNAQLEVLSASLVAWRQLDSGLAEFQQVLGQDRGTLKGLEGALNKGEAATAVALAQNVNLVVKLLPEQQKLQTAPSNMSHMHATSLHIAKFAASNSSLSDSGISDGGAMSDGGLSEREHRLNVLRRLAKQLENTLAPGSAAMTSIAARIETAEADLKQLQSTCRELIVRSATTQQQQQQPSTNDLSGLKCKKDSHKCAEALTSKPEDNAATDEEPNKKSSKKMNWLWRIAKAALPVQLVLITFFCIACFMQPNCCDNMNGLSLSFTPQLRYVRGPPPI